MNKNERIHQLEDALLKVEKILKKLNEFLGRKKKEEKKLKKMCFEHSELILLYNCIKLS